MLWYVDMSETTVLGGLATCLVNISKSDMISLLVGHMKATFATSHLLHTNHFLRFAVKKTDWNMSKIFPKSDDVIVISPRWTSQQDLTCSAPWAGSVLHTLPGSRWPKQCSSRRTRALRCLAKAVMLPCHAMIDLQDWHKLPATFRLRS